jgi:TRAP-type mannitol/chloroaromatic compound transport system permease large subunit
MREGKPISHITAGLIIAAAIIILSVVMSIAGAGNDPGGGSISYIVMILGLVLFIRQHGKATDYTQSFGELFSYGFKATTMVILIFVVFLIAMSYIQPELKQKVMEATRLELEKRKNFTDTEIDRMMDMTSRYFWIVLIGTSMFFLALVGAVGSLIGAAVTKKRSNNPFEQTTH